MIESSIKTATEYFQNFFSYEYYPKGFLQKVDSRIKFVGILALLLAVVSTFKIPKIMAILFSALVLAKLSNIGLKDILKRVWLFTTFSFVIVLPLYFSEGWYYVLSFTLRVLTAITLLQLLVLTTPFNEILYVLRAFKVPETLVFSLGLTYRYIHLMFSELMRILIARESRRVRKFGYREIWKDGGKMLGSFFIRVYEKGERVQRAITLRGDKLRCYSTQFKFGMTEALFIVFVTVVLIWWIKL